jgi:hypothetical protein
MTPVAPFSPKIGSERAGYGRSRENRLCLEADNCSLVLHDKFPDDLRLHRSNVGCNKYSATGKGFSSLAYAYLRYQCNLLAISVNFLPFQGNLSTARLLAYEGPRATVEGSGRLRLWE